jgi:hypothetical protein
MKEVFMVSFTHSPTLQLAIEDRVTGTESDMKTSGIEDADKNLHDTDV